MHGGPTSERHETSRNLDTGRSKGAGAGLPGGQWSPSRARESVNQGARKGQAHGSLAASRSIRPGLHSGIVLYHGRRPQIPHNLPLSLSLRSPPPAASDARQPSCLLPTFSFTHGDRRALARRADHAKWRRLSYKLLRAPKPTPSDPLSARGLAVLPGPHPHPPGR